MSRAAGTFAGNDVVDLTSESARGPLDPERAARHLTDSELADERSVCDPVVFWSLFAAKEAACKAFEQAGRTTPRGAFRSLEVDLAASTVTHRDSGEIARLALSLAPESLHAVAVYGDGDFAPPVWHGIAHRPDGADPSDRAREVLVAELARRIPGSCPAEFAIGSRDGIPRVLWRGRWRNWSVSLAHSGAFVAWSAVDPTPGG